MLIKNEVENLPIEAEEKHIVKLLNHYLDKIGCDSLLYYNYGHIDDAVFYYFFKANADKINAKLFYCGIQIEEDNSTPENIIFVKDNSALSVLTLLLTNAIAIINPRTQLSTRIIGAPLHYTIKVFSDYSPNYLYKMAEYYQIPKTMIAPYSVDEKHYAMLEEYLYGTKLTNKYTSADIREFLDTIKKQQINNAIIYNSITYNFMKEVQDL